RRKAHPVRGHEEEGRARADKTNGERSELASRQETGTPQNRNENERGNCEAKKAERGRVQRVRHCMTRAGNPPAPDQDEGGDVSKAEKIGRRAGRYPLGLRFGHLNSGAAPAATRPRDLRYPPSFAISASETSKFA